MALICLSGQVVSGLPLACSLTGCCPVSLAQSKSHPAASTTIITSPCTFFKITPVRQRGFTQSESIYNLCDPLGLIDHCIIFSAGHVEPLGPTSKCQNDFIIKNFCKQHINCNSFYYIMFYRCPKG